MKKQIISLTTSSLIIFQNGLCMPIVYAQENTPNLVLDTQNPRGMSVVYLGDADGNMNEGDGTLKKPYQNIRAALDNVAEGGTIKLVGEVSYTKYEPHPDGSAMPLIIDKDVIIEGASGKPPLYGDADTFILRAPIQLDADVTFRNINLSMVPQTTLGGPSSNSKVLGQHDPLGATIFVAGNKLTLDNVSTKVGTNPDQYNQRPYVSGGAFKGTGSVGPKSVINVINPNSETVLSGIFAGDYWNSRDLDVEINLDGKVLENKIYTGGLTNELNGTVDINLGTKSTVYSFDKTNHQGEVNVNFKPNFTKENVDLNGVNNLSIGENTKIILKKNSTFDVNDVILSEGSMLDFRTVNGHPIVRGNFIGKTNTSNSTGGSIMLKDTQTLEVTGDVTGRTKLNYDGTVFNEALTEGHEYVRAKSSSTGDFTVTPTLANALTVNRNTNDSKAIWTVEKNQNTFKDFRWGNCPDVITNPQRGEEYVFPIEFLNENNNVYLPYDTDWDDFTFSITKADGCTLDEDSVYDDDEVFFYISRFGSAIVLEVSDPNYIGDITLTVKHNPSNTIISTTTTVKRQILDISGDVSITGNATPGNTITAKVDNIPYNAGKLEYKWYLNDSVIEGETSNTLKLTEAHVGSIRVEVSAENYKNVLVSDAVTVKLPEKPVVVKPQAVNGLKAVSNGYNSIKITWSSVNEADGYELYSSTSKTGNYSLKTDINTVSYNDSSLVTGKTYYYKVRAYKIVDGEKVYGDYSSVVEAKPALSTTKAKATVASYNSNKITWDKVNGANGYVVYRATSKDGTYSACKTITSGSTLSHTDTNLTTGKTYYYKVRAYRTVDNKKVYSSYSSVVNAKPALSTTKAKAAVASYNSNKITWDKVNGANGYVVYRATSKDGTYSACKTITSGSTLSHTDTNLTTGKTYYYKVRAYRTVDNKKVYSSYSSVVNAKPSLKTPSITLNTTSKKATIKWSKIAGANGYDVYRATSKNGSYSKVKSITSGSTVSYTDSKLTTGKTYYYKIRAYKTVNGKKVYSSYSTVKSIKIK